MVQNGCTIYYEDSNEMPTIEDRILRLFERDNREYLSSEIASLAGISRNSARPALTRMVRKGLLRRRGRGIYGANPTVGVGNVFEPMRIQNLRLVAETMDGERLRVPSWVRYRPHVGFVEVLELAGLGLTEEDKVRLRFQVGSKRVKLTFTAKAPLGLDLYGLQFALHWLGGMLETYEFTGHVNWVVDRGTEMFKDYPNIDLDSLGAKAITLGEFEGFVQKVYQKSYGVRREIKVERQTSLDAINNIVMGGMSSGTILNMNALALREMEVQSKAIRSWSVGASDTQQALQSMMPQFLQAVFKLIDKVDRLAGEVQELRKRSK